MDKEKLAHDMEECGDELSRIQIDIAGVAVAGDQITANSVKEFAPLLTKAARDSYNKITKVKQRLEEIKWQMLELKE